MEKLILQALIRCCVLMAAVGLAQAQDYPARGIRVVLPFAPGGGIDVLARLFAQRWQEAFGHSVIVDNRAGAGGNIGAEIVAKAPPDGYTLLFGAAALAANATLYPKMGFEPRKVLVAVCHIASVPALLTVHPSVPARTAQDVVALSQKTKGGIRFGSNGTGTASHLAGALFQQRSGTALTHVPYKGAAPALHALIGGEIEMAFPAVSSAAPFLRAHKLRAIAVTTQKRSAVLPEVPTLDAVFPGFDIANWNMLFAPAGTPAAIVARLNAETLKALQHDDVRKFMTREGADAVGGTPAEAAAFFASEIEKLARIIKTAGVSAE